MSCVIDWNINCPNLNKDKKKQMNEYIVNWKRIEDFIKQGRIVYGSEVIMADSVEETRRKFNKAFIACSITQITLIPKKN